MLTNAKLLIALGQAANKLDMNPKSIQIDEHSMRGVCIAFDGREIPFHIAMRARVGTIKQVRDVIIEELAHLINEAPAAAE
jgi:hypothetical protein